MNKIKPKLENHCNSYTFVFEKLGKVLKSILKKEFVWHINKYHKNELIYVRSLLDRFWTDAIILPIESTTVEFKRCIQNRSV